MSHYDLNPATWTTETARPELDRLTGQKYNLSWSAEAGERADMLVYADVDIVGHAYHADDKQPDLIYCGHHKGDLRLFVEVPFTDPELVREFLGLLKAINKGLLKLKGCRHGR